MPRWTKWNTCGTCGMTLALTHSFLCKAMGHSLQHRAKGLLCLHPHHEPEEIKSISFCSPVLFWFTLTSLGYRGTELQAERWQQTWNSPLRSEEETEAINSVMWVLAFHVVFSATCISLAMLPGDQRPYLSSGISTWTLTRGGLCITEFSSWHGPIPVNKKRFPHSCTTVILRYSEVVGQETHDRASCSTVCTSHFLG